MVLVRLPTVAVTFAINRFKWCNRAAVVIFLFILLLVAAANNSPQLFEPHFRSMVVLLMVVTLNWITKRLLPLYTKWILWHSDYCLFVPVSIAEFFLVVVWSIYLQNSLFALIFLSSFADNTEYSNSIPQKTTIIIVTVIKIEKRKGIKVK